MNTMKRYAWILVVIIGLVELFLALLLFFKSSNSPTTETSQKQTQAAEPPSPSASLTPTPQLSSTKIPRYPAQVLNLKNWKITLPISGKVNADEVKQPQLATYKLDPWFVVSDDGKGIRFRAPVNGATTSGSGYPRSELREMTNNGMTQASWSSTTGVHTMFLDEAITAVPKVKQHVVAGQIHDNSDDITVIRLEYPNLYVNVGGKNVYTLDPQYTLGKRFTIKWVVSDGQTKLYYNNSKDPVYILTKDYANSYFKTGVYTQSNCSREGSPVSCNANNYGETVVYQAIVTHQ